MENKAIRKTMLLLAMALFGVAFLCAPAWAASPRTLIGVPVPTPPNLADFVKNTAVATQLGKAFFWDMQVGSDGVQACASCHFQAGADIRWRNQVDPGLRASPPDFTFQMGGPNVSLRPGHFPTATNDIVGSQGCVNANFAGVVAGSAIDAFTPAADPNGFQVGGLNTRRVTARNTPSAINAVFNFNNFWDGRASNVFNGNNPSGAPANCWSNDPVQGLIQVPVAISNASAASQATGPPNADEMAWAGRTWPYIGKKMLTLTPLAKQKVSPTDSLLGSLAAPTKGLTTTYTALIQAAFVDSWWNDTTTPIVIGADTFTQMEANFSLFWGLAIQLYEATLISDLTRFDLFDSGIDPNALNAQEQQGLNIFNGKAGCAGCHGGHFLSDASESAPDKQMDNIGVRPVSDDIGAFAVFGAGFEGKFKVSPLRNVELNGPYFHNGGKLTLEEVIDFYNRGGDFPNPAIGSLGLTAQERADLKAFLLTLTDERVRQEMAPFDHPELLIPSGHPGGTVSMSCADGINACDSFITLAAVGAGGRPAAGLSPLQPFSPREVRGDFEGDGNADVAIYRPGEGNWYILPSSTGSYYLRQWGLSTDSIVSGDYDGDGKADYAVWRPGEGNWYIIRSSDGGVIQTQWGTGTLFPDSDVPVPGDYDGDGKTDIAVWRPGDGVWYIIRSSDGAVEVYQWGTGSLNDAPVPGDYDGDGKTDCAVWRPGDGNWYIRRSSDGAVEVYQWGTGSLFDVPVPGDYDGDGKVDCAVWRQGEGNWYIRRSSDGAVEVYQWGTGTLFAKPDVPVPGDYDGDGKIDCAVWRPGDGYWYIRRSSDGGVTLTQWGADYLNDEPIWQ